MTKTICQSVGCFERYKTLKSVSVGSGRVGSLKLRKWSYSAKTHSTFGFARNNTIHLHNSDKNLVGRDLNLRHGSDAPLRDADWRALILDIFDSPFRGGDWRALISTPLTRPSEAAIEGFWSRHLWLAPQRRRLKGSDLDTSDSLFRGADWRALIPDTSWVSLIQSLTRCRWTSHWKKTNWLWCYHLWRKTIQLLAFCLTKTGNDIVKVHAC